MAAKAHARARAGQIIRRPRLLLLLAACGAMLVVGLTAITASGAYFTASSVQGPNTISAGGVLLGVAPASEILDLADIAPGVSRSGSVVVTNTLSAAVVTLGIADLQQSPSGAGLDAILDVEVRETSPSPRVLFTGKLADLHGVVTGTMATAASATYAITVAWPEVEDDPSRQGAAADFVFEWTAVST